MQLRTSHHPTTLWPSARLPCAHSRIFNLQVMVTKGLKTQISQEEEEVLIRRGGEQVGLDFRRQEQVVGTYEPHPTIFSLHLGKLVLIYTRIWWVSGLHGNSLNALRAQLTPTISYCSNIMLPINFLGLLAQIELVTTNIICIADILQWTCMDFTKI